MIQITLKVRNLANPKFWEGLRELRKQPMRPLLAFHLNAAVRNLELKQQDWQAVSNAAILKYGRKEEGRPHFIPMEDRVAIENYHKDMEAIINEEIIVLLPSKIPFPLEPITPEILDAIFPLLEGPTIVPDEEVKKP